jgi:TonB family protein
MNPRTLLLVIVLLIAPATFSQQTNPINIAPNAPKDKPVDAAGDEELRRIEEALKPYIQKAKSTYPEAKDRFVKGLPAKHGFFVTTRLHDSQGHEEQVFIAVKQITDGTISGLIWSDIRLVSGYRLGQSYSFPESELIDWTITQPDGAEEGNFVGKFLDSYQIEMSHFAKDGLAFSYPTGWTLTDQSTAEAQRLLISLAGSSIQIMVIAQRAVTPRDQLEPLRQKVNAELIRIVSEKLGAPGKSLDTAAVQQQVGETQAAGVRLEFTSDRETRTGEIYSLRRGLRLVNLVFLRADKDTTQGVPVWEGVLSSLHVDPPVLTALTMAASQEVTSSTENNILNGKALELPKPAYPQLARVAHAAGIVEVQVVIDENGEVISAAAVSGHPLLQASCVAAARMARFSPTLLEGEPVRVTGVIQYHFVAQ